MGIREGNLNLKELNKNFRKMVKIYHPDINYNNESETIKKINKAYEILKKQSYKNKTEKNNKKEVYDLRFYKKSYNRKHEEKEVIKVNLMELLKYNTKTELLENLSNKSSLIEKRIIVEIEYSMKVNDFSIVEKINVPFNNLKEYHLGSKIDNFLLKGNYEGIVEVGLLVGDFDLGLVKVKRGKINKIRYKLGDKNKIDIIFDIQIIG